MSPQDENFVRRFVETCRADDRVLACFLGGSNARGTADAYSDLDIYVITTNVAHREFVQESRAFLSRLGNPVFADDFGLEKTVFFIFAKGTEGELGIGRESEFLHIHSGPYISLLDKSGVLEGVEFPVHEVETSRQIDLLRGLIDGFWHDFSHFVTAMGRRQLWWAYGQLEALRGMCVKLARLRYNFADSEIGDEPYFKIENVMRVERLAVLQCTFCAMEFDAMLGAANAVLEFYRDNAKSLCETYRIPYPAESDRVVTERFETIKR
jgi:predicted nucleotidyltransferase